MEGKLFTHFKFSSLSPVLPDNGRNQELPYEWQLPLTSLLRTGKPENNQYAIRHSFPLRGNGRTTRSKRPLYPDKNSGMYQ